MFARRREPKTASEAASVPTRGEERTCWESRRHAVVLARPLLRAFALALAGLACFVVGWPLMLLTLVLASFAGSLVGVLVLATRKGGMQAALPFGTFLALGAVVAAVAGDVILAWYLGFY